MRLRPASLRVMVVAVLASLLALAPAALGATGATLRSALASWTSAHPETSALVWRLDPGGGEPVPILSWRPEVARAPASVMKLVTAGGALLALGPDYQFRTRLVAGPGTAQRGAVLTGPVYLVGAGDPTLSTAAFARAQWGMAGRFGKLATPLRARGISLVRGPIVADESLFDSRRTGLEWKDSYRYECPPLSALAVNRNLTDSGGLVASPPIAAGQRLRAALRSAGVRQQGDVRSGRAPQNGAVLAEVLSPPLREVVALMNPSSDNFLAETLRKDVGAYSGSGGSTAQGNAETTEILRQRGIMGLTDRLVDGSGLSRSNRLSAGTLVRLLAAAAADPAWGDALIRSMAHGGEGTLIRRFTDPAISHRVRAKTGYIDGVASLAGVVTSKSGTRFAFAILINDYDIGGAHDTQDRIVTLLAQGAGDTAGAVTAARSR